MSAEAGPGPSTMTMNMTSSPLVPASVKKLRAKKRMINIVNPADPESFSTDQTSMEESHHEPMRRDREVTPVRDTELNVVVSETPLGSELAKRGILRPSGTPGSGNGVRFFPKNRFRVITPNNSMSQHPSSPASKAALAASTSTPERRKQSLLTQLLAVAMPSVSPEKPPPPTKPDESWEQPGQEGEISLVASSTTSGMVDDEEYDVDQSLHHDEEEVEGDSWNGTPFIISSPLNLPEGDSRDISAQELNPPQEEELEQTEGIRDDRSREWMIPDDMSNLMNEKWSPTDPSFSISDPPPRQTPPHMPRPTRNLGMRSFERSPSISLIEDNSTGTDIMATVRKRASPPRESSFATNAPATPTPAIKPIGSIFAEMSAEQADMSWTLPCEGDSPLRSTVFAHDASALNLPPLSARSEKHSTPMIGDKTEFFDCSTSGFDLSPLAGKMATQSTAGSSRLIVPTKNLFEAQNEHTRALVEEVRLYRDLATRLHAEVVERDGVLADLNVRVLDREVLRSTVENLREEVEKLKASPKRSRDSRDSSVSPLSAKSAHVHAGDRTTVVQAETRDLEIRLSKALADQEMLQQQMNDIRHQSQTKDRELDSTRQALIELEDRHRDHLIGSRHSPPVESNHAELEEAQGRCSDLAFELTRVTDLAHDLQTQVQEMREVKAADEEEIDRLNSAMEGIRSSKRSEEDMKLRLEDTERRVDAEMRRREEMEGYLREERDARKRLEAENRELVKSIQATRLQLAHTPTTASVDPGLQAEVARLRSESASKDLEITTLQRRKVELKEDREMLNIALDSKQQELELIKRKFAVKGVAGATPLGLSTKTNERPHRSGLYADTPAVPSTAVKSRRRSSMNQQFITPSLVNGDKRALRSSAMLNSLAVPRGGVENTPAQRGYGSLRGGRLPA